MFIKYLNKIVLSYFIDHIEGSYLDISIKLETSSHLINLTHYRLHTNSVIFFLPDLKHAIT